MRLTRETLIKIARDTAAQRAKISRRIICIYLTGSVTEDTPLLGGTTDIDLVIIQDSDPLQPREIVRMSEDVHLDIAYFDQAVFHHPRHLRIDPWLGPFIYKKPLVLYDTQHWFDFIQASTGAQFMQPDYVSQRASSLAQSARQAWFDLELKSDEPHAKKILRYLQALQDAGNSLASLNGEPVAERRFFLLIPQRLQSFNNASLTSGLAHLLAPQNDQWQNAWPEWMVAWKKAYQTSSIQLDAPIQLHASRLAYYEKAITSLWNDNITASLWVLARTWTMAAGCLPAESEQVQEWQAAMKLLGMDPENFSSRLEQIDTYLDMVEEIIETWARQNGVSSIDEI
jgi:hypothetical protein